VTDLTLSSMPSNADAITREEAAGILAVHVATVDRLIRRRAHRRHLSGSASRTAAAVNPRPAQSGL